MSELLGIFVVVLQLVGTILFKFYGWVVLVAVLGYMIWQNKRRTQWAQDVEHTLLLIEVPRENEKKELSAEQMLASLHGILRPKTELVKEGTLQEHISFEIMAGEGRIRFYVWTPRHLKDFVESQIYAQYPNVNITEAEDDYARVTEAGEKVLYGTEITLTKTDVLPIKTFPSFEVDPLAGVTAGLSKLEKGENIWIQILARPADDDWQDRGNDFIDKLKSGKGIGFKDLLLELPLHIGANIFRGLVAPPESTTKEVKKDDKLSTAQSTLVKAVEEKITKLGYEVKIRILYLGQDQNMARLRLQSIVGGFKQFNTNNLNGFAAGKYTNGQDFLTDYRARLFVDSGYILNIEELASLYHLPHSSVETPNIAWTTFKASEPPADLPAEGLTAPEEVSLFGLTNFRGQRIKFGIKRADRGRHLYVVGQTGTGKSFLLQLLALSDIYHDQGFAVIDPHGDLASDIMRYIPEHRLKDVVYFNPADTDYPIAFNPMEVTDLDFKNNISSEIVGVLKRMFDSWGPRLEYILRYTILALLDYPDSTMLGITRMLTDKEFRKKVVRRIEDPVVKNFWLNEFASWNDKFANEAVAPVLNKVGAFTANPLIRNVIGQPKSAMNLRKVMDEGKILIINLSQGLIGEDNASVLGALMVTKLQLAAMSRANLPHAQRRPFYLYVDEFQNFATDSFAVILSEARKYGLYLTVANQYIAQISETAVKDAVFGNVGSIVTFRVGADDASYLAKYFEPVFESSDLVKLHNRSILLSMSIDGEKSVPFSANTLRMPEPQQDNSQSIIDQSRERYASRRGEVEEMVNNWSYDAHQKEKQSEFEAAQSAPEQKPNMLKDLKNPQSSPDNRPRPNANQHQRGQDGRDQKQRPQRPKDNRQDRPKTEQAAQQPSGSGELSPDQAIDVRRGK